MTFLTNFLNDGAVGAFLQSNEKASADNHQNNNPVKEPKENQIIKPLTKEQHPQYEVINAITNKVAKRDCGHFKNKFADIYMPLILSPEKSKEWTLAVAEKQDDSPYCTAFNDFWDTVLKDPWNYIKLDIKNGKCPVQESIMKWLKDL